MTLDKKLKTGRNILILLFAFLLLNDLVILPLMTNMRPNLIRTALTLWLCWATYKGSYFARGLSVVLFAAAGIHGLFSEYFLVKIEYTYLIVLFIGSALALTCIPQTVAFLRYQNENKKKRKPSKIL